MDSTPVLLAVLGNRIEAQLMVGLLTSHGLRAAMVTDDAGGQEPQLDLQGGVRVLVAAPDEESARQLLDSAGDADVPSERVLSRPGEPLRTPARSRRRSN